jgi:hypothetical protein
MRQLSRQPLGGIEKMIIDMKLLQISILLVLSLQGCKNNNQEKFIYQPDKDINSFQEFKSSLKEATFVMPERRRQQILDNYSKLRINLLKDQVIQLIGKPDYSEVMASKENDGRYGYCWKYLFHFNLHDSPNEKLDTCITISFDQTGKLKRAIPQNILGVNKIDTTMPPNQRLKLTE